MVLRVRGASGRRIVEFAGLDASPFEETDELRGLLSQDMFCRNDPGLTEEAEAVERPDKDDECVNGGADIKSSAGYVR